MEQSHPDSTRPDDNHGGSEEPLSDYVKRMETGENLKRLAEKLGNDLKSTSKPDVPTPDLSFEKFEQKRKARDRQ
ncbi:MAG: hypothetical protein J7619_25670 [Dyadobacter sp.]|uniref:hypothetical protein n=1 Tax=Dyadobacter sp. TaxID=1914288 RepID=UPI001B15754C|nr:hypothetical protein [Dyadobacter sp.]MBO9616109.1 hypothetical protein [Dyadobacter sp.]